MEKLSQDGLFINGLRYAFPKTADGYIARLVVMEQEALTPHEATFILDMLAAHRITWSINIDLPRLREKLMDIADPES